MPAVNDPVGLPERKPWTSGMAPAYIGTFLWVAFFDGLGPNVLPTGGLAPALGGVVAAGILAYLLLYRVPASWGFTSRRPLDDLAGATFGTKGALLVPNLLIGLGQVGLFAVGLGYATDFLLGGLVNWGLIEPRVLRPVAWGGTMVPAPLFLTAALLWGTIAALGGVKIVGWIAAIMQYFPVFPAVGLALAVAATFTGLTGFRPSGIDPLTGTLVAPDLGARLAFLAAFQWTFAFTALLGITGADWGAASLSLADVRKGGWIGLAVAPIVVASLALLAVAGHEGKVQQRAEVVADAVPRGSSLPGPRSIDSAPLPIPAPTAAFGRYTFRAALEGGLERRVAATILLVFGLASLAPVCYAAHEFSRRFARIVPSFSPLAWTLVGIASGWLLIVGGWSERTDVVFPVLGALFAPVAGAIVATSPRRRDLGPDQADAQVNPAGLLAWGAGVAVGLAPLLARAVGAAGLARVPVASLLAFLAAFLVYRVAAAVGLEPRAATPRSA